MNERMDSMPVGVVIERRDLDNPWQDHEWTVVSVVPGAGEIADWLELARGDGWVRYHMGSSILELHRKETEAYRVNLSNDPPMVYVVLRTTDDADEPHELELFLVTASAYDAQDYLDSGEDIVEAVVMPGDMVAWVQAFIDTHHVDEPFRKRKRKRYDPDAVGFGRPAPADQRRKGNGVG